MILHFQTNPTWSVSDYFRLDTHLVEIVFLTKLQPLSIGKYKVRTSDQIFSIVAL